MKQGIFTVLKNERLTGQVYRMDLSGDTSAVTAPGQFVNLKIDGLYLRRPISVCDCDGDVLTLIYKAVGKGTELMASWQPGRQADILSGLGNGYSPEEAGERPLLLGGGAGVPPLYLLAKRLLAEGKRVTAVLGFNTASEVFWEEEFKALGVRTLVTTADGSYGLRGFVTDALGEAGDSTYFYACGPEPMLKAVYKASKTEGQLSFERRMGCGFGACMGCSCRALTGYKRICREGPVMRKEEILWED